MLRPDFQRFYDDVEALYRQAIDEKNPMDRRDLTDQMGILIEIWSYLRNHPHPRAITRPQSPEFKIPKRGPTC
jgi:hypothetical protein